MDLDMKVNFIKIFVMGLESGNHLLKNKLALKHSTLDSLKIIWKMVKESIFTRMEPIIKAIL